MLNFSDTLQHCKSLVSDVLTLSDNTLQYCKSLVSGVLTLSDNTLQYLKSLVSDVLTLSDNTSSHPSVAYGSTGSAGGGVYSV